VESGGCPESAKGIRRYVGVFKKLNILKNMLAAHGCLTVPLFHEMCRIKTEKEYMMFKNNHKELIEKMTEKFREEKEEKILEKKKRCQEKSKEYVKNQQGYYKILYQGPRFIIYRKPNGVKETFYGNAKIVGNYIYIENKTSKI